MSGPHRNFLNPAAASNDPIAFVKTNIARNADARRWRDLMLHYQNRIGDVRMNEESVRVRVLALVNATLELERLTDGLVAGRGGKLLRKSTYDKQGYPQTLVYERGDPHLLMHLTGLIQSLLKSLVWTNITAATKSRMARQLGLNGHYLESSRGQLSAGIEVPGFSDIGISNSRP